MYPVIHIIRRKGRHEYRCGTDAQGYRAPCGRLQYPFDDPDRLAEHILSKWRDESDLSQTWGPERIARDLKTIIDEKNGNYIDLDGFSDVVQSITEGDTAETIFLLGRKEVNALREVAGYLMESNPFNEADGIDRLPSDGKAKLPLQLFKFTIEKLTDIENGGKEPNPDLNEEGIMALNGAYKYTEWLYRTYDIL